MQPRVFGLIHDAHPTATKLFDNPVVGDVLADEPVGSATVPPVDQELLLRNEYLAAENRILKAQIKGRLLLSQKEKATSTQTFRDFREAQFRKVKLEKSQEHLHGNDPSPQKKRRAPEGASLLVGFFYLLPSAHARREEYCRRREEPCVRKLGSHMEAIEPAFSFPTAVATVERQEILVVEMHLDFVKVWSEIDGFAEIKVVRLGAGFFRKPRQVGLGIESAQRTAPTPRIAGIDRPDIDVFFLSAFNGRI